jgi:hypothetical protein
MRGNSAGGFVDSLFFRLLLTGTAEMNLIAPATVATSLSNERDDCK